MSEAARSPPPILNRSIVSPHFGHLNPLMFSTIPITGMPSSFAKVTDFLESRRATSCGVVTTIAPSRFGINWATLSGSSPVPGGRSTMRQSRSPQKTSERNCFIAPILSGPLHTTGVSLLASRNASDMTFTRGGTMTGAIPPSETSGRASSIPSILGTFGP
uniref:Uncharacterized protein n=1 Tax=Candidatus Methanogaster sp. ANME-2c ERB4 TaxID=2759911 RepID=A0A7G9YBD1_9EURY|nr:hypothetical protein MMIICKHE_00003 [Methanosarcinales archaeon ANME-2c ERB4]